MTVRRRRSAPTAVGALTIGLAAILVGAGGATAGSGAVGQGAPDVVRLVLIDQRFAFAADGDLRLTYRVEGTLPELVADPAAGQGDAGETGGTAPTTTVAAGQLPGDDQPPEDEVPEAVDELRVVVVNYERLSPTANVDRYLGADARTARVADPIDGLVVVEARDLLSVAEDGTVTLDLTVGTDRGESVEDRLRFDDPGVYPVVVSLVDGEGPDGEVLASHATLVQRLPGPDEDRSPPPTDLAVAVAVPEIGPDADAGETADAAGQLAAALALTVAVESPVTLAVPPVVLDAAATEDRDGVAQALAGDRLVSVPLAPLDVSSAAAAGVTDAFARRLREGEDLLTSAVPTNVARRDVWIATGPLSAAGAQVVRDLGYRYVVMTPALFEDVVAREVPATDLFVAIELPDGGTLPLLVVDDLGRQLTTEATDAVLAERPALEWALAVTADLVLGQERDGDLDRSRILATPDLTAPDPRLLVALEQVVATTPSVRFTEAGALPGVTDVDRVGGDRQTVRLPVTAGVDLTRRVDRLDAAAVAMLSVGSMLPADDPRPAQWAAEISDLVSTGYSEADVQATIDRLTAEAERLKSSVVPPEPFTFTLTGRSGDIDLRLGNTSAEPLTVLLRLSSPKLAFPDGEQLIELVPNDQTLVAVPVRARTNGTSSVQVELLTPAGETIHDPVVLTSRVNALTGFGQVLTGGLVLVLFTWWFSHWRARRRERVAAEATTTVERHPSGVK